MAFGSGAMTNSIGEIRNADCIFVIGSNTTENHPIIALQVKAAVRQRGAKLIVADPRRIELVSFAHLWIQHRPGTDVALINGMIHTILAHGWQNQTFIQERTEGFEALADSVREYTPEAVEKITGVPAGQLVEAARLYATSPNSTILYAMGITQHVTGTNNVLALANLSMVAGQIGKPFSGVNPLRGQNNVQGACDMGGLPNVYPGYQRVDNEGVRRKFEEAWDVSLSPETRPDPDGDDERDCRRENQGPVCHGREPHPHGSQRQPGEGGAAAPGSLGDAGYLPVRDRGIGPRNPSGGEFRGKGRDVSPTPSAESSGFAGL